MYCASTVYVYLAKHQDLSPMDVSNLEAVINAMQAIGRTHQITNAFLQQAYHDIERNGLSSRIRFPTLSNYRNYFGDTHSSIPLLARTHVSGHRNVAPVLPGKLPLDNPIGSVPPSGPIPRGTDATIKCLTNTECFQPVLGAVTRNVAPTVSPTINMDAVTDAHGNKRKRMSASPAPDLGGNYRMQGPGKGNYMSPSMAQGAAWRFSQQAINENGTFTMSLPDRSGSSNASSPAYRSGGSGSFSHGGNGAGTGTGSDPYSGSSQPSPSTGLGNTPEENRIDLRALQDRVTGPIWTDNDAFMAQIADSLVNGELPGGVGSSWNFLTGDLPAWQTDSSL